MSVNTLSSYGELHFIFVSVERNVVLPVMRRHNNFNARSPGCIFLPEKLIILSFLSVLCSDIIKCPLSCVGLGVA